MHSKFSESELNEIEKQLSCPTGENGIEVAKKMNQSNFGMTKSAIDFLEFQNASTILELGHGNCGHLDYLLQKSKTITYYGLEVSETMWKEAAILNKNKPAEFKLYDGNNIPFQDQFFDAIFTVNTVYFWSEPELLIQEIERVLKDDGTFVLTFAYKSFMKNLPFVGDKFQLFEEEDIQGLAGKSGLQIVDTKKETDEVKSKVGEKVMRKFTTVKMKKNVSVL